MRAALDEAVLTPHRAISPLTGKALENLACNYMTATTLIQRLARRYDSAVLEQLIHLPLLDEAQSNDRERLREWTQTLMSRLNDRPGERSVYRRS